MAGRHSFLWSTWPPLIPAREAIYSLVGGFVKLLQQPLSDIPRIALDKEEEKEDLD